MRNRNRNPQHRLIFGAIIMVIGVLALIDNLHIFYAQHLLNFWPTILIVFGIVKLSQSRGNSGAIFGGVMILAGVIMTLNNLGFVRISMRDAWPVFLIGAGLLVIFKDRTVKTLEGAIVNGEASPQNSQSAQIDIVAVMSGNQGNITSQNFQGGEITAIMGGVELDLRNASIQTEAVVNILAFWGGVVLKVPQDWTVVNNCTGFLGGIDDSTIPGMNANKRLVITGTALMGGIEIKN